jgi:hypothetical protein
MVAKGEKDLPVDLSGATHVSTVSVAEQELVYVTWTQPPMYGLEPSLAE